MEFYNIDGTVVYTDNDANSIFAGKKASFYGDSLTEVNYQYTKGYHAWVKEILGLASYKNYGKSGDTIKNCIAKITSDDADIVFVQIGVNDMNYNTPLGVLGDSTDDTIYGGYDVLCQKVRTDYPTKIIVFISPHYQTRYPHTGGVTSYQVSRAMIEVATKYSIPVYDNYVFSEINSSNLSYYTNDGCHWNDKGHEMVGKNLSKWVLDTFRYLYTS